MSTKIELRNLLKEYLTEEDYLCCLLSIKPEYAISIFNRTKRYEYRLRAPKKRISKVFLYSTKPNKKIEGYFVPGKIIYGNPDAIWDKTKQYSGVNKEKYYDYCGYHNEIYAISINETYQFSNQLNPFILTNFTAPQSFIYF